MRNTQTSMSRNEPIVDIAGKGEVVYDDGKQKDRTPGLGGRFQQQLIDRSQRRITYLRMSVTDRCDFRCVYCMSEKMTFLPRARLMTLEELAQIGRAFTELGVDKIRITGGEPLVRKNVLWLLRKLNQLPGLGELALSTNGSQLPRLASDLRDAGVRRVNISLDTLRPDRFRRITRVGDLDNVLRGIDAALDAGFDRVKLNSLILRNRNHDEVPALVRFAIDHGTDISFIEEMPLGHGDNHIRAETYYSSDELLVELQRHHTLTQTAETTRGPSRYYRITGTDTRVGFISPHSHNFCAACNRVRVTIEGKLLLCLGQEHAVDLARVLRAHPGNLERLKQAIIGAMTIKPVGHDFDLNTHPVIFRHMSVTGG